MKFGSYGTKLRCVCSLGKRRFLSLSSGEDQTKGNNRSRPAVRSLDLGKFLGRLELLFFSNKNGSARPIPDPELTFGNQNGNWSG